MRIRSLQPVRYAALAVLISMTGCMDATGPQPSVPAQIVPLTNNTLEGEPGFALAQPVAVKVVDDLGRGVGGQTVAFAVAEGQGSVSPAEATTDAEGIARSTWTLGPNPGSNTLRVEARGIKLNIVTVHAVAKESKGASIVRVSGGGGTVIGGCALADPLTVRVLDKNGNPVAGAIVEFDAAGDGTVVPAVATTNAEGIAQGVWHPSTTGGGTTARAVLRTAARPSVEFTAESLPIAPGGFATIGNKIYDSSCQVHIFHGAARPSLEWNAGGDDNFVNVGEQLALLKSWGANVLRLPTSQVYWVPGNKQYDPGYKQRVIDTVRKARALGLAVIVDLHNSDRGNPNYAEVPDVQRLPDRAHSLTFWKDVATTFKDDGGVIFELYNEPNEITWDQWLHGGIMPEGPKYPGGPWAESYEAVGMQEVYDTVRATGARNLVIISGLHWGYNLSQIADYKVKGYNIAYASHPYDWPDKQPEVWEAEWGKAADIVPVIITEFGAYRCDRMDYVRQVLDYADRKNIGWIAWAWWTPPPVSSTYTAEQRENTICGFPTLLRDWNGTPSPSGEIIRQRMLSY